MPVRKANWSASQALAWIIVHRPLSLEQGEWTPDMGPQIIDAQKTLTAAAAGGELQAWGRKQPHGPLEPIPSDLFRIPGLAVGEHGDVRFLRRHKPYEGQPWYTIEFDAAQIRKTFPSPPPLSTENWMLANALSNTKREYLIRDCMQATGCTKRAAEAAYKKLPPDRRRQRGRPKRGSNQL